MFCSDGDSCKSAVLNKTSTFHWDQNGTKPRPGLGLYVKYDFRLVNHNMSQQNEFLNRRI
jgi:hypothetical protein